MLKQMLKLFKYVNDNNLGLEKRYQVQLMTIIEDNEITVSESEENPDKILKQMILVKLRQ